MTRHLVRGVKHVANTPRSLVYAMAVSFFGCSFAYMLIEHKGPVESMWWAIVTGATVGYGDQYPETTAGRGVGAVLIVSFVVLLMFAGAQLTAKMIADPDCFSDEEQEQMKRDIADIKAMLEEVRGGPVTHQVIVNSISDISNDELRKLISVQKDLNTK